MAGNTHYLWLEQVPVTFDPLDQLESAFFDPNNFQMFCVQHGYTDVRVKGLTEEDSFKITLPARGPVSTIKFSAGHPKILSVQRRKASVEFVNIFAENSMEKSLPIKSNGSDIIGFYWVFKNEYVVVITAATVELYQCNPYRMTFKLVKSYTMAISWAIYSPEELVLLVCNKGTNVIQPFAFKQGVAVPIIKLVKFDVDLPPPTMRDAKSVLMERDVVIMNLYKVQYIAVIRNATQASQGADVLLYQLYPDSPARLAHVLGIDVSGRFTLSVVDNLVIVHHQAWKTSMLFDISHCSDPSGLVKRHQPFLAPLSIAPTKLEVKQKGNRLHKNESLSQVSSKEPQSTSNRSSPMPSTKVVVPELYSPKWVFFQPNIIVDAQHGVIWKLGLSLSSISNMMTDKGRLMQFLLMRENGKAVILSVCQDCLEPGRQANLGVVGSMFDQMNLSCKALSLPESERKYRVVISQKDVYTNLFAPFSDRKDMPYKFLVAVVVEYIRSLHKLQIPVEHFLFEMVMNLLIENKCFYQLHQFLQYHVIGDSKPLACLLLSRELVYSPATQLAMDMFKRLSTAESEIVDILLSRGQILSALRYVKAVDKVDSVSARQFLEAAANEDDKMLFYTVYKFFEERNLRLRRKPEFPPDEHCHPYEELYKKWFSENN